MFDTLAVAQQLAAGCVDRDQAEVHRPKRSATASNRATTSPPTSPKAGLAEVRTEIANLDKRLFDPDRESLTDEPRIHIR